MSPEELIAYARGYVDGWNRSDANAEWRDFTSEVQEAMRLSAAAGRRRAWDEAVRRGENPTPFDTQGETMGKDKTRGETPIWEDRRHPKGTHPIQPTTDRALEPGPNGGQGSDR